MNTTNDLRAMRTIIHDKVEGRFQMILNAAYSSSQFKGSEEPSLKCEKTSLSELDFTYDLKTTLDSNRNEYRLLTEIKTTMRRQGETLNDIANRVFKNYKDQFNRLIKASQNLTQNNKNGQCLWSIVVGIYRKNPKSIYEAFNDDDYNLLILYGVDSINYAYHFYHSFAQLEFNVRYYKSLNSWLNDQTLYNFESMKFDDILGWQAFPKNEFPNQELKLDFQEIESKPMKRPKRRHKIIIDEELANQAREFCKEKSRKNIEIAEFLNISHNSLNRWRNNPDNPNHSLMIELAGEMNPKYKKKKDPVIEPIEDFQPDKMLIEVIWKAIAMFIFLVFLAILATSFF